MVTAISCFMPHPRLHQVDRVAGFDSNPRPGGMVGAGYSATWAFLLEPIGADATRLIVRVRGDFAPTLRMAMARPAIQSGHAIMKHAQLRNLKRRAESLVEGR